MRRCSLLLALILFCAPLRAQEFDFRLSPQPDDAALAAAMSDLALRILPVYEDRDTERYLANLSALQLASGNADPATQTRRFLRERRSASGRHLRLARVLFHDVQMQARAQDEIYAQAYARALREALAGLSDREAHALGRLCSRSPQAARGVLLAGLDTLQGRTRLRFDEAMDLIWKYLAYEAYRRSAALAPAVIAEDQGRRYLREDGITLETRAGVTLDLRVVRPRGELARATLLELTLDRGADAAAASAAHGFIGVVAILRRGSGALMPFRHDGEDARAVIAWIARQPWSDGRVGMLGEGYGGFAAWAALKRPPAALKAVATLNPMAPGIDFPAEGRVMRNAALRWAVELESGQATGAAAWNDLDRRWFASDEPYRRFERTAPARSENFRTWLAHPSYDRWWQKAIPHGKDYAGLEIPVLTLLDSTAPGEAAALHYLREHQRERAQADHTLLLAARESARHDPAAQLDLRELRLQWFEQVLGAAPAPPVLAQRVNVRVAGTQAWRQGPTLDALAADALRLHLQPALAPGPHRLRVEADTDAALEIEVDLRSAAAAAPLRFVSEPLKQSAELIGVPRGELDLWIDAFDVDLRIAAWEQRANGERVALFDPYVFRASYAQDRTQRRLLRNGVRQRLRFEVERLVARRLAAGSRLVLELGVNHTPGYQLNYGGNGEVSAQSRGQRRRPLKMRWYASSFIELPMRP